MLLALLPCKAESLLTAALTIQRTSNSVLCRCSRTDCDNYARIMVRFDEVAQSINLIRKCLQDLPAGLFGAGASAKPGRPGTVVKHPGES